MDNVFLGYFSSTEAGHAEDNLMRYIREHDLVGALLEIFLNTSPCSSEYGTSKKKEGCQEELAEFSRKRGLTIEVGADHPYQPRGVPGGKSLSREAAANSPMYTEFLKGNAQMKK